MIAERSLTALKLIDTISSKANKVNFINDTELTDALKYLENSGIPNNKHEDYKYCNMDAVFKKEFKNITQQFNALTSKDVNPYKLDEAINLVVVNGSYTESLSDKIIVKGVTIKCLNDFSNNKKSPIASLSKSNSDAFIALNNAFSDNGIYIQIEKGNVIPMPIQIIYINSAKSESLVNSRSFSEFSRIFNSPVNFSSSSSTGDTESISFI